MIINYICKVVGWEPIILDDNLVIHDLIFKLYFPVHQIFELSFSFRHTHSDHKWLTVGLLLLDLLCAEVLQAKSIIHSFGVFLATDLHSHFCKALRSAKTWVGIAILYLHSKKCERWIKKNLLASAAKRTLHRCRVATIDSMVRGDLMSHPYHWESQDPLPIRDLPTASSWWCLLRSHPPHDYGQCPRSLGGNRHHFTSRRDSCRVLSSDRRYASSRSD